MKVELNHFYNCDCMELLKSLPDKFIDLAICDKTFMFGNSIKPNYCKKCGQKLDWSDIDD